MSGMPDIDVDVADRDAILEGFRHIPAMLDSGRRHNSGVYFHSVPADPFTGLCSVPYREAEERGFFKMDILNVHVYRKVRDRAHLDELSSREPVWDALAVPQFCERLIHLGSHGKVCARMRPRSIMQLAAVLALIRPAKKHLIGRPWKEVMAEIWKKDPDGGYSFKKAHAVAYAELVRVHMNLVMDELRGLAGES